MCLCELWAFRALSGVVHLMNVISPTCVISIVYITSSMSFTRYMIFQNCRHSDLNCILQCYSPQYYHLHISKLIFRLKNQNLNRFLQSLAFTKFKSGLYNLKTSMCFAFSNFSKPGAGWGFSYWGDVAVDHNSIKSNEIGFIYHFQNILI